MQKANRILIVGAGAVGQCYGFHLMQAGYHVTFLIKPYQHDVLTHGINVHCLNGPFRGRHHFNRFDLLTDSDALDAGPFDQVWLAVSGPALLGAWLPNLLGRMATQTVVCLHPTPDMQAMVRSRIGTTPAFVSGLIGFISYPGPLDSSESDSGMRWWFPPFTASLFEGPTGVTSTIVAALNRVGCPAKTVTNLGPLAFDASAVLMAFVGHLELSGWSMERFLVSSSVRRFKQTALQMLQPTSVAHRIGLSVFCRRWILRCVFAVARRLSPFDIEAYLKLHFKKVADQTRAMVKFYLATAQRQGRSTPALRDLSSRLAATQMDSMGTRSAPIGDDAEHIDMKGL
ncbi:MAG: 2-dehydropantoate 2-reductase N-terminal domain-containing protein [Myxococcota bacterium]|nr:2-dehydropantoate 2-reductase N-terminal domain-containing protein [Myxococcota bacterium]